MKRWIFHKIGTFGTKLVFLLTQIISVATMVKLVSPQVPTQYHPGRELVSPSPPLDNYVLGCVPSQQSRQRSVCLPLADNRVLGQCLSFWPQRLYVNRLPLY